MTHRSIVLLVEARVIHSIKISKAKYYVELKKNVIFTFEPQKLFKQKRSIQIKVAN